MLGVDLQMRIKSFVRSIVGFIGVSFLLANTALAAPIIMSGDYVRTAISDDGTLGYGGSTTPGLLHDASGTGTFTDDYLTPGSPWEIFSVFTNEANLQRNNNALGDDISGVLTDISGTSPYDFAVNWLGSYGSFYTISTDTYFNTGDERVGFTTTITALSDLSGLQFLRAIDPDPDATSYGVYNTNNGRGNGSLAANDFVYSEGTTTGLTLGLYSDSAITHNTGISDLWSTSPATYLAGTDDGNGDNVIGLAFDIGSLLAGSSVSFSYYYVMGDNIDNVDTPVGVPEPTTLAILALGLVGLILRRKKV